MEEFETKKITLIQKEYINVFDYLNNNFNLSSCEQHYKKIILYGRVAEVDKAYKYLLENNLVLPAEKKLTDISNTKSEWDI